jgi:hypothetical protein
MADWETTPTEWEVASAPLGVWEATTTEWDVASTAQTFNSTVEVDENI